MAAATWVGKISTIVHAGNDATITIVNDGLHPVGATGTITGNFVVVTTDGTGNNIEQVLGGVNDTVAISITKGL